MATEIIHTLRVTCDWEGTQIGKAEGQRVTLAYEGQDYEMELCAHAAELYHKTMLDLIAKARKTNKLRPMEASKPCGTEVDIAEMPPPEKPAKPPRKTPKTQRPKIKEFARKNGFPVPPYGGRMTKECEDAYDAEYGVIA